MRQTTLLAAGGTIASTSAASSGATPELDAAALVAAAGLDVAGARSVRSLPGVHLTLDDALAIARQAVAEAGGGRGVVVTTGTDTLEELAVLCHAMNGAEAPIVFTGAIRPASAPGADGPANLLDAVAVAGAAPAGTYVVFAGEVHAALEARKVDSTSPRAFGSPRTGPLGHVAEGRVDLRAAPPPGPGLAVERLDFDVPIVPTWLGDDGALLRAVDPDALVLVALGAGHVAPAVLRELRAATCPVAVTVRPERGELLHATYGFEGAEPDVRASGAIPAATRSPQAARMLLLAGLGAGSNRAGLEALVGDSA
ncbi:MAG TPA: asparaginase domain-containing protein [Solirubrobacteraceae bacterium]|nr:asparaginase domain-containing protein [Solirubrobacteraceae bacterium]